MAPIVINAARTIGTTIGTAALNGAAVGAFGGALYVTLGAVVKTAAGVSSAASSVKDRAGTWWANRAARATVVQP